MNNLTIKPIIPTSYKYYGEAQSVNIRYAIATIDSNNIVENAHEFVSCREYLTAFLYTIYHKKLVNLEYLEYLNYFINTLQDIPRDHLYLIVKITAYKTFQRNFKNYMHYYDELLNVESPTELIIPELSKNKYLIIKCDLLWTKNLVVFSILSWILRLFCYSLNNTDIEPFEQLVTNPKFKRVTDVFPINHIKFKNILQFLYIFPELYKQYGDVYYTNYHNLEYSFRGNGIYYFITALNNYIYNGYKYNTTFTNILKTYKQLCDANPVIPSFRKKNDKLVGLQNQ